MDAILDANTIGLPETFIKKLGTGRVIVREVNDGILLIPIQNEKSNLRGLLKNTGYSTNKFFEQKQQDKELE